MTAEPKQKAVLLFKELMMGWGDHVKTDEYKSKRGKRKRREK